MEASQTIDIIKNLVYSFKSMYLKLYILINIYEEL